MKREDTKNKRKKVGGTGQEKAIIQYTFTLKNMRNNETEAIFREMLSRKFPGLKMYKELLKMNKI